ncbi:MAG: ABC transporter permease [Spirochaetes bacterium]|nr:ABC transporter permease [Spirochaetota bacterium]
MTFLRVLATELMKLRRTRVPWVLALVYAVTPLMLALMMVVLQDPELARKMGLLAAKAQMTVGYANWPAYLSIASFLFVGGMIVVSIAQAFVFGREYAEGTAKNMLTLPVGRSVIVAAKLTVTALWFLGAGALVYGEAIGLGRLVGLPGWDPELLSRHAFTVGRIAAQVLLLSSVPAWITVAARGYIAPLGFSVLLLLVGDLFAHTGWGPWVPWSIVLLTAGVAGPDAPLPGAASWMVLVAVFVAGSIGTWVSLDRADNTQ